MKKLLLITACMLVALVVNSQTLEEIVKKYSSANKLDKITSFNTIKIIGKMSAMGMEFPMELWMKNPNKIKIVTSMNDQDAIQVFDGIKGYTVNPMAGTSTPTEMDQESASSLLRSNLFQNYFANCLREGKMSLEPEEAVNGVPCFKLKINAEGGAVIFFFIDKSTYLVIKNTANIMSQGTAVTVESFPSDYKDFSGVLIPSKTTTSASGMEFVIEYTNVEVNIPMDDSIFTIKQ